MFKSVLARFVCASAVALAMPVPVLAQEEAPSVAVEESADQDVLPPGASSNDTFDSKLHGGSEDSADEPPQAREETKPTQRRSATSDAEAREAAKRAEKALFSDPAKDKAVANPLLDGRGADYYDRRAKEILKNDADKGRVDLHPLMQAHPDDYVVVCTAGCPSGLSSSIVSLLPKPPVAPATPYPSAQGDQISCAAGCGANGKRSFAGAPVTAVAATVGEWMTTVAKVPAGAGTPVPKAVQSGDWMEKINRERDEASKASASSAAPVTAKAATVPLTAPAPEKREIAAASEMTASKVGVALPLTKAETVATTPKPTVTAVPAQTKLAAVATKPAEPIAARAAGEMTARKDGVALPVTKAETVTTTPKQTETAPAVPAHNKLAAVAVKPGDPVAARPAAQPVVKAQTAVVVAPANPPIVAEAKPTIVPHGITDAKMEAAKATAPSQTVVAVEAKPSAAAAATPSALKQIAALEPAPTVTSEKPAATPAPAPTVARPLPAAPAASAVTVTEMAKPAESKSGSLFKDSTKVAAVSPPVTEKPAAAAPAQTTQVAKERVISVLSEDKDMNAAIHKARASIGMFWKSYETPGAGETDHALKVAVAGNGTTEHFWLTRIKRDGEKYSGVISNQPQSVKTVKIGQRFQFTADMVSDWTFKRHGKLVGNETMRVLLPRMPEEQAAVYRQMYETP